jgi:DUF1680 family protein
MKKTTLTLFILLNLLNWLDAKNILQPVEFNKVRLEDQFWKPRLITQAKTLVPFAIEKNSPAIENLEKTGKFLKGDKSDLPFPHRFISSDLYKVMEGAAYLLKTKPDEKLEKQMDDIIDIIASAQKKDGYLYVAHTCDVSANSKYERKHMGASPYSFVIHSHELYNMGHMYEGAIAYYQATGKDKWLKVAEKSAQHINKVFFEGDKNYNNGEPINQAPGHEELELALVKLYRATGNQLYLEMAQKFLDIRGVSFVPKGTGVNSPEYAQQHKPVADQRKAVGHSVRATYLYTGMADVVSITGDEKYDKALESIWHNIVDTRMHITGGLGAIHGIEGFGPEYDLPNDCYNETCAAIGNVLFNYRMFLKTKDAKYIDVAEVSLYNNSLAGVNFDGNKFFYVNPLVANGHKAFNHGKKGRSPWFGCACCPTNIARLIPQISGMMYAQDDESIYLSFYASNSTTINIGGANINLIQRTNYPMDGHIKLKVEMEGAKNFSVKLRIPTWLNNQFVPGDLYSYKNKLANNFTVKVNNQIVNTTIKNGFINLDRNWKNGDEVTLDLPMPTRFNDCNTKVRANIDRVAVTRGPLVFCAEEIDNKTNVLHFGINRYENMDVKDNKFRKGKLKNIVRLSVPAKKVTPNGIEISEMIMVPYYAWNNRGDASMNVWFPTKTDMLSYKEYGVSYGGKFKKVKASYTCTNDDIAAISSDESPKSSVDETVKRWTSWPKKGEPQSIEIELKKLTELESIGVYWFEDDKGVRLPKSWNLEYWENGKWNEFPVYVTDSYYLFKDQYNIVHPASNIKTSKIRLNIQAKKEYSVGVLDVVIN